MPKSQIAILVLLRKFVFATPKVTPFLLVKLLFAARFLWQRGQVFWQSFSTSSLPYYIATNTANLRLAEAEPEHNEEAEKHCQDDPDRASNPVAVPLQ